MERSTLDVERWAFSLFYIRVTIFLGCGFAAKYREGGGVLSVPLQWMLGLMRLKLDAIWLELLPATNDPRTDQVRIANFQQRLRGHGLAGRYCLLYQKPANDAHDLAGMDCIGISKRELLDRLAGTECSAQSRVFHSSAAVTEIRAAHFLRSRSERNLLLDDQDGDGAIVSSRILDDWAQR